MVMTEIPNRLQEWRLRTRHSQREVGLIVGYSVASVLRHEHGSRGLTHKAILAYAGLYKIPTYALFVHPADEGLIEDRTITENRLWELVIASKLTSEEIFKLTAILPQTLHVIGLDMVAMTHAEIVALAKVFKVPTYQLFVEPFGNDEGWFSDDVNAELNPIYEDSITGDPGTVYETFTGGYEARATMGTAL